MSYDIYKSITSVAREFPTCCYSLLCQTITLDTATCFAKGNLLYSLFVLILYGFYCVYFTLIRTSHV